MRVLIEFNPILYYFLDPVQINFYKFYDENVKKNDGFVCFQFDTRYFNWLCVSVYSLSLTQNFD